MNRKKVFPVYYRWHDSDIDGTYYIVATDPIEAEEIAYECIVANLPSGEGPDLPASFGRRVAKVWVRDYQAAETLCDRSGLLGTGDAAYNARAYALLVSQTGAFH